MVAVSARLSGIISFSASTLIAIPGEDGGVYIKCVIVKLQIAKKPLIQGCKNIVIIGCAVLIEEALKVRFSYINFKDFFSL